MVLILGSLMSPLNRSDPARIRKSKRKAFETDLVTLDEYWEKLTQHMRQDDIAVIILFSGRIKHWTCVKAITPEAMILSDSIGLKRLPGITALLIQ